MSTPPQQPAAQQTLKRTATWIKKELTLRQILRDARALKQFRDFSQSIQASENINFWVAVEFFKVQHISTPRSSGKARKRFSENLRSLDAGELNKTEDENVFGSTPGRQSVKMVDIITPEYLSKLDIPDAQKLIIKDAARIFSTFLEDNAPSWCFMEPKMVDTIRRKLKSTDVDLSIFNRAQDFVYNTLNVEIFPRFLHKVIAEPEKFSSMERFELPDEVSKALTPKMSVRSMLNIVKEEED